MNQMHESKNQCTAGLTAAALALALLCGGVSTSCGGGSESHEGHEHGSETEDEHAHEGEHSEEPAVAKSDAHHIAENRTQCQDDVALSEAAVSRYGITVEPVRALPLVPKIAAPGHLAFPQGAIARVGSAVPGRIVEIRVRSGDSVAKGDALLVIESPALGEGQSEYLQKRTIAATVGPSLDLAKNAFERSKELFDRVQGIALSEVQKREVELRAAERDRELARSAEMAALNSLILLGMDEQGIKTLEESGKVSPQFTVRSPIDGSIVELSVTHGELVGPEKDRLLVVGDLRILWAIAEVSEALLPEIAIGATAIVKVPALGKASTEGKVAAFPTVLEAATRTAEVRIEVPNPDRTMLPGMFIQVEIESSRGAGAPILAVPDGAVLTIEGRPSVFVPLELGSSTFCKHEVEVGAPVGTHIPVLSGLTAGELVVVAGTFRLKAQHGKASAQHEH